MKGSVLVFGIQGDELVLERTYSDDRQFLITEYGAKRRGKKLIKHFPRSRFHATKKDITARLRTFHESCDFVSGMSGLSVLDAARCAELDIRLGDYEAGVVGLMTSAVNRVRSQLPKVRYGLVYGSSAMGVDLSIEQVAKEQNIPLVGFTCLEYLWYVSNKVKGPHICVLPTKDAYCKHYVHNCDLLMASNGGQVSYKKDIIAATEALIPVLPIDVIGMLGGIRSCVQARWNSKRCCGSPAPCDATHWLPK